MKTMIGVIGGSGIYEIAGLENPTWTAVDTPWGSPSDAILTGRLKGLDMAFLPRHGRGHIHSPSSVPYRANIAALKQLGCTDVVAVSAVGSLDKDMAPGDFVLVDQYIDRTQGRASSFFDSGCVAHVSLARPTCARLGQSLAGAAQSVGITLHQGATYLAMEGPQFSTRAESLMYRQWGAQVIGMTGMPEAKLAREAELCYASLAMVTDFDCWHPDHDAVDVSAVIATLAANAAYARETLAALHGFITSDISRAPCPCGCDRALDHAIITAPSKRDPQLIEKLTLVAGRILQG